MAIWDDFPNLPKSVKKLDLFAEEELGELKLSIS